MRPKPYADCPEESSLQEVAAEMTSPETSTNVLHHASQCDHCGPLLKQYLDDFSDELSPEIEAIIDQLPYSQPQWQREKAKELAAGVQPPFWPALWKKTVGWVSAFKIPAMAGALATVIAGVGITRGPVIMNWWQLRNATQSISAANAQKQTIIGRLTGVKPGPFTPNSQNMSGSGGGHDLKWKPMIDAEGMLPSDLDSGGKVDPRWLQIRGRIRLLTNPDGAEAAESDFQAAREQGVKDRSLDIDLALAYFEKSRRDKTNFKKTIDKLTEVLESTDPAPTAEERKTALYNLGLAHERMNDWGSAIATWEQYLEADPAGDWADIARRHRDDDRKKAPTHPVYWNPPIYNQHSREPGVIRNAEQQQQIALERDWLTPAIEDPASEAGKAVSNIAENFRQQHSDPMLVDLISPTGKGGNPSMPALNTSFAPNNQQKDAVECSVKDGENGRLGAMRALSAAFTYNKNDKQEEAIGCSRKAAGLFARSGNLAGELLAGYQEIYALQRELDADGCLEKLDKLWPRAFATRYYWLQGELALEKAICANLAFKSTTTERSLDQSIEIARDFHFRELGLRIIGMKAGIARLNGQYDDAWRETIDGLDQYWKDDYSTERYYQFYAVMRSIAEKSGSLYASEVYLRRSMDVFEATAPEDLELKFVLSASLANLLHQLHQDNAAEAEAKRARDLIRSTQAGKAVVPAYLELPAIDLADFELRRGQPGLALSTLKPIGNVPRTADKFVKLDFFQVRGEAKRRLGRFDEAAEDYRQGIHLAQEFFSQFTNNEVRRLSWVNATNRIYAGFVQILLAKGQDEKALKVWEWSKRQLLDRANRHLLDVSAGADALPLPKTTYPHIVYASFEDRLQIWVVKDGRAAGKSVLVEQTELLGSVSNFNTKCKDKDSLESEVEKQGAKLYELFLQPVIADLGPSGTVAIEFDDAIPSFAIDALKSPGGSYFGDDHVILQSPGILAETLLNDPAPLKPPDKFLVADASPESGPEVLHGHDLPAEAISRAYPRLSILKNATLIPENMDREMQSSAALLVISHGVRGSEGMGLKLAPDWSLRAKDFIPEHVGRLRLAVLEACSSGYSENGLLAPDNMVRALLASKVPNVIASRWDVDSQSTGELFESFYTYLGQGETPAKALQHARRKLRTTEPDRLQERPKRTHPYYWGGFYLTGKAN